MDRCLSENGILEAMDTWPKYGCMPDGRFIRLTKENEKDYVPYVHYDDMVKVVKGIPSLEVAPVVHAHWIKRELTDDFGEHYWTLYYCSNCDYETPYSEFRYCPDCGAKMNDEVNDDNTCL